MRHASTSLPSQLPPGDGQHAPHRPIPADRYGGDVLAGGATVRKTAKASTPVPATNGLVVEDATTGWCGAVVRVEKSGGMHIVVVEDRHKRVRTFPLGPGFLIDGKPVNLTAPVSAPTQTTPTRTASGSKAVAGVKARVARGSRLWVEGIHDAELVEKVWGEDLRIEGVVVEPLHGVDDLVSAVRNFNPGPGRRLGILLDHLIEGSKESRIANEVQQACPAAAKHVLITGHPFVDIWQAVRPQRLALQSWPVIPRGLPWKEGVLKALGRPHASAADIAQGWKWVLSNVHSYTDLEPSLLGRVEELVDFVTEN